jgi:hypothetical protein
MSGKPIPLRPGSITHQLLQRTLRKPFSSHDNAIHVLLENKLPKGAMYSNSLQILAANDTIFQDDTEQKLTVRIPIQPTRGPYVDVQSATETSEQTDGTMTVATVSLITMQERDPLDTNNTVPTTTRLPDTSTVLSALRNAVPTGREPKQRPYDLPVRSRTPDSSTDDDNPIEKTDHPVRIRRKPTRSRTTQDIRRPIELFCARTPPDPLLQQHHPTGEHDWRQRHY